MLLVELLEQFSNDCRNYVIVKTRASFSTNEKQNHNQSCTRDFSRASSELQVIARNCDWFMALFVRVVIGWSNCFGFGFSIAT